MSLIAVFEFFFFTMGTVNNKLLFGPIINVRFLIECRLWYSFCSIYMNSKVFMDLKYLIGGKYDVDRIVEFNFTGFLICEDDLLDS